VIAAARAHNFATGAFLKKVGATVARVEGTTIFLTFTESKDPFHDRFRVPVEAAVEQVFGTKLHVRMDGEGGSAPVTSAPSAPQARAAAPKNAPSAPAPTSAPEDVPPPPQDYDEMDLPSPDDEDAGVLGLTGVALLQEMMGAEIIEEVEDDD
jgi:hypothetical protein